MMTKIFKMLGALLGLLSVPVAERDEAAMAKTMKQLKDALEEAKSSGDADAIQRVADLEKEVKALKAAHDEQASQLIKLNKMGLTFGADGRRVEVLDYEKIISLQRVGHVFRYQDQAEAFGALTARAIFGGTPRYGDMVAQRTRDLAESLTKEIKAAYEKDLDPGVSTAGADLVANLYMADLIANLEAVGVMFTECDRVPLQTLGSTTWPTLTGELTAYPTAVATQFTESNPTFSTVTMTPVKWGTLTAVPNEFFRNPTLLAPLGQRIGLLIVRALSYAFDNSVVNGDGTASYGTIDGLLHNTNLTSASPATGTDLISEYDGADVGAVPIALNKDYVTDPKWYMSLSAERTLRNIRTTTDAEAIYQRGSNNEPNTIDGYPYKTCQRFPAAASITASTKWGAFGDLRLAYFFGMLTGIQIAQSEHVRFESDVTMLRGLAHVDAALKDANAVVIAKSAAAS